MLPQWNPPASQPFTCAPSASSLASHVSARGYFLSTVFRESKEVATTPALRQKKGDVGSINHTIKCITSTIKAGLTMLTNMQQNRNTNTPRSRHKNATARPRAEK